MRPEMLANVVEMAASEQALSVVTNWPDDQFEQSPTTQLDELSVKLGLASNSSPAYVTGALTNSGLVTMTREPLSLTELSPMTVVSVHLATVFVVPDPVTPIGICEIVAFRLLPP